MNSLPNSTEVDSKAAVQQRVSQQEQLFKRSLLLSRNPRLSTNEKARLRSIQQDLIQDMSSPNTSTT